MMLTLRYFVLRYFYLIPPVQERRLRRQLRKLNISADAARYARFASLPT